MNRLIQKSRHRRLLAGVLFMAILYQALVPTGFMPANDGSLSLKVCHSGLPAAGDDGRHAGRHSHTDFCPFGAVPGAGPIVHVAALAVSWSPVLQVNSDIAAQRPFTQLHRAHPARGPPFPA